MTTPVPPALEREARVFTRALIGQVPTRYVIERYAAAHVALPLVPAAGFEKRLVALAATGPFCARLADAYARRFVTRATLRAKLATLLAILESAAPSDAAFAPVAASAAGVVLRLGVAGAAAALLSVLGLVIVGPVHLASRIAGRS